MGHQIVRFSTLGQLDVLVEGHGSVTALLGQPKRMAVLVHLALSAPAGARPRDVLQAMFWPEVDHRRAQHSLRQTLHLLRQHLPPGLLSARRGQDVALDRTLFTCDAHEFEDLVRREKWEQALSLYGGDLLPGLFLGESAAFEEWLERERKRLRQVAVRAALRLARRQTGTGERSEALAALMLAAHLSPYEEVVLREVVEMLLLLDDRAAAAALYRDFVKRLHTDLGIPPSPQTLALGAAVEQPSAGVVSVGGEVRGDVRDAGSRPERAPPPAPPRFSPVALDVFHLYQKGRSLVEQRTPAAVRQAMRSFEQALRLEPRFAEAHEGLAEAWMVLPVYTRISAEEGRARVFHHSEQALRLEPRLAAAHAHMAWARLVYDWDWAEAERGFLRALELAPRCMEAHLPYAVYLLSSMGRFDEATAQLERARATHPIAPHLSAYLAMVRYFARDYERALSECDAVLELAPDFPLAQWVKAWIQTAIGDGEGALIAARGAVAATGGSRLMIAVQGHAAATAGDLEQARLLLRDLAAAGPGREPIPEFFTAAIHTALGETDIAINLLYEGYRGRSPHMVLAPVIPLFDPLHSNSRFRELPLRMGLTGAGV